MCFLNNVNHAHNSFKININLKKSNVTKIVIYVNENLINFTFKIIYFKCL